MNTLINKNTKVLVQGITGNQGSFHTQKMLAYGTKIVSGVTPGKGGQKIAGISIFNTVSEAQKYQKADFSILFVPARFVKSAAYEALENNLNIIIITERVPVMDTISIIQKAKEKKLTVIGPNCPGIIIPGETKIGIMPGNIFKKGNLGIVSRSGTLTYEVVNYLSHACLGQRAVVGIGGDPIVGSDFIDILKLFEKDPKIKKIILLGEIGGNAEETTAEYIKKHIKKQVVAYIAGKTAPEGKTMGHAGAIVSGSSGKAETKISALKSVGVQIANLPSQIPQLLMKT